MDLQLTVWFERLRAARRDGSRPGCRGRGGRAGRGRPGRPAARTVSRDRSLAVEAAGVAEPDLARPGPAWRSSSVAHGHLGDGARDRRGQAPGQPQGVGGLGAELGPRGQAAGEPDHPDEAAGVRGRRRPGRAPDPWRRRPPPPRPSPSTAAGVRSVTDDLHAAPQAAVRARTSSTHGQGRHPAPAAPRSTSISCSPGRSRPPRPRRRRPSGRPRRL